MTPSPTPSPRARLIVATYEQLPHLRRALRGVLRQTTRDFSVVVADDGSGEDTRAYLRGFAAEAASEGLEVTHLWQEDRGFRKNGILNAAVRLPGPESLLIFTDGDCIPPAHFVARHLEAHEKRSFHVGGAVRLSREVSQALAEADVDAGRYERFIGPSDRRDLRRRARKSRWGVFLHRRNRPKVLGLNLAVDRALLEEINGFDEAFESWGLGEDSDVRDRLMRLRPRPRVKVLYGRNDVFHLWHLPAPGGRALSRPYYDQPRPIRCLRGLVDLRSGAAAPAAEASPARGPGER